MISDTKTTTQKHHRYTTIYKHEANILKNPDNLPWLMHVLFTGTSRELKPGGFSTCPRLPERWDCTHLPLSSAGWLQRGRLSPF